MKLQNSNGRVNKRRIDAKARLEKQLVDNTKTIRNEDGIFADIPLTDEDKTRIKKEIAILNDKIVSPQMARSLRTKKTGTRSGHKFKMS